MPRRYIPVSPRMQRKFESHGCVFKTQWWENGEPVDTPSGDPVEEPGKAVATLMHPIIAPDGSYVGDAKVGGNHVRWLARHGIFEPQCPDGKTSCIGKHKDGRWIGWSHRAACGFKIGSTVKKGDCAYTPRTPEELKADITTPDDDGYAWQQPENVELLENGVRVHPEPFMVHAMATPETLVETIESLPDKLGDPTVPMVHPDAPPYFDIDCGRGEWTAKTDDDAKQMAIDFANSVS